MSWDPSEHTCRPYFLEWPLEIAAAAISSKTKFHNRQPQDWNCAGNKGFLRTTSIQPKHAKNLAWYLYPDSHILAVNCLPCKVQVHVAVLKIAKKLHKPPWIWKVSPDSPSVASAEYGNIEISGNILDQIFRWHVSHLCGTMTMVFKPFKIYMGRSSMHKERMTNFYFSLPFVKLLSLSW